VSYPTAVTIVSFAALAAIAADLLLRVAFRRTKAASPGARGGFVAWLRMAVNLAGLGCLAAAVVTGFSPALQNNGTMTGDALITHVSVAPPFAIAAVVVAIFWANRNRFSASDWSRLTSPGACAAPLRKLFFWISVALAIPTLVSILAAMFPIFGTDEQQTLVQIHRYCALFLAGSGFLFAYFALMAWREGSKD
jgi:hypothetical protein